MQLGWIQGQGPEVQMGRSSGAALVRTSDLASGDSLHFALVPELELGSEPEAGHEAESECWSGFVGAEAAVFAATVENLSVEAEFEQNLGHRMCHGRWQESTPFQIELL